MRKLLLDRAKCTTDTPNRAAQRGESTSGLATRPASRAQAHPFHAHVPSTFLYASYKRTQRPAANLRYRASTDDRNARHPAEFSRAAARTAPSPSFDFLLVGRKVAKATSKGGVAVDGGPRVQIRAPRPRRRLGGPPGASIEAGEAESKRASKSHVSPVTCGGAKPARIVAF